MREHAYVAGHVVGVLAEVGVALRECRLQHGRYQLDAAAARGGLLAVHALVGQAQGLRGRACLARQLHDAGGSGDGEGAAVFGERFARLGKAPVRILHEVRQQHAELVSAQPVAGPVPSHGSCEALAEAREQRIAGDMAEGVVVLLEAVEVEEAKERRLIFACRLAHPGQVLHQRAPVAQACERVSQQLAPHAAAGEHERDDRGDEDQQRQREQAQHRAAPRVEEVGPRRGRGGDDGHVPARGADRERQLRHHRAVAAVGDQTRVGPETCAAERKRLLRLDAAGCDPVRGAVQLQATFPVAGQLHVHARRIVRDEAHAARVHHADVEMRHAAQAPVDAHGSEEGHRELAAER